MLVLKALGKISSFLFSALTKSMDITLTSKKGRAVLLGTFLLFALLSYNLPEKYQLLNLIERRGTASSLPADKALSEGGIDRRSFSEGGQQMVLAETTTADLPAGASAQAGQDNETIQLTGTLTDKDGQPSEGNYTARIAIYSKDRTTLDPYPSDQDKNIRIWEETQTITIKKGIFNLELGQNKALPLLTTTSNQFYIGLRIGEDSEMVPRKKISTPLFALNAGNAVTLNGKKLGTEAGDIIVLDENGLININNLPIGTNKDELVIGSDKRLKYSISGASYISLSGQTFKLNDIDLTSDITGTLATTNGGTGLDSYMKGDILYYNEGDTLTKLPISTNGQALIIENGLPVWGAISGGLIAANSLDFTELKNSLTLDGSLTIDPTANNYSINIDSNTLFINTQNNRIGIGNNAPTESLDITGNAKISGTLTANSLIISGGATIGTLGLNIAMNSSLIPSTTGLNLGSSANHWSNIYVDNLSVGGTDMNGTSSEFFAINTDSSTDENMGLRFYRSSLNGYAGLFWNATSQNFNLFKRENTSTLADLNVQNFYAGGNVGIGTTNPSQKLSIVGSEVITNSLGSDRNTNGGYEEVSTVPWEGRYQQSGPTLTGLGQDDTTVIDGQYSGKVVRWRGGISWFGQKNIQVTPNALYKITLSTKLQKALSGARGNVSIRVVNSATAQTQLNIGTQINYVELDRFSTSVQYEELYVTPTVGSYLSVYIYADDKDGGVEPDTYTVYADQLSVKEVTIPAFSIKQDNGTNIFNATWSGVDEGRVSIYDGGVENIRFDSASSSWFNGGNLGIGTTSPNTKLEIAGGSLRLADSYNLQWGGGTNYITGSNASNYLALATNGSERLRIDSNGNVGIGTGSPDASLHVIAVAAPGGTGGDSIYDITENGVSYRVHKFTTVGAATFTPPAGVTSVEVLVVAGGGAAGDGVPGHWTGSTGGGGGVLYGTLDVSTGPKNVVVGAGGNGVNAGSGGNGANSSFDTTYVANGGGGGGKVAGETPGNGFAGGTGGSGGGGGAAYGSSYSGGRGGSSNQSSIGTLTGYGSAGGNGRTYPTVPSGYEGGGGGAGSAGVNNIPGSGRSFSITGSSLVYAVAGQYANIAATANSGNGGNGSSANTTGLSGGSGIVVVRYVWTASAQLKLGYDANNYWSNIVDPSGALTMTGTGAGGVSNIHSSPR
jgi:hypothetical protein